MRIDVLDEGAIAPEVLLSHESFLAVNVERILLVIIKVWSFFEHSLWYKIDDTVLSRLPLRMHVHQAIGPAIARRHSHLLNRAR